MRHHNPTASSFWSSKRGKKIYEPHDSQYVNSYYNTGFKNANSNRSYVKILQYIYDHPKCSRAQILVDVYGFGNLEHARKFGRGHASGIFSQLLYINVIDYDSNYRYTITDSGKEVLKRAYANDMLNMMKISKR